MGLPNLRRWTVLTGVPAYASADALIPSILKSQPPRLPQITGTAYTFHNPLVNEVTNSCATVLHASIMVS